LAVVLWSYIDAAWLPTIIRRTNERIENELIAQIRGEVPASGNIAQKLALSGHDLAVLECEMVGHRKHLLLAYGLAKFAGAFSAHRFYLGEITYAIATVCAGALACAALLAAVFLSVDHAADGSSAPIVVGALIVAFVVNGLVIVDEYRLPDVIERENLQIERDVMARLQPPALAQA
jgi:hypothetical protein